MGTVTTEQVQLGIGVRVQFCWQIFKSATKQHNQKIVMEKLPKQLEKLDHQCFPNSTVTWLTLKSLPKLEKPYIRGGILATLGESKWSEDKTSRLKYLNELKTTWVK
uniref:Uncharacterized protein n=1 Tax=Quercus lobata TaxID=97700 RepID=A0A7N2RED7_QUELO